jgi:transposase
MKRKKYSPEFKREAIELVRRSGASCRQVALEIGVAPNLLTRWVREAQPGTEKAFPGTGSPRDEELARLKRELARVTKERDFLRDAAAYFVRNHRAVHGDPALPQRVPGTSDVPLPEGFCQWLLRLAGS